MRDIRKLSSELTAAEKVLRKADRRLQRAEWALAARTAVAFVAVCVERRPEGYVIPVSDAHRTRFGGPLGSYVFLPGAGSYAGKVAASHGVAGCPSFPLCYGKPHKTSVCMSYVRRLRDNGKSVIEIAMTAYPAEERAAAEALVRDHIARHEQQAAGASK